MRTCGKTKLRFVALAILSAMLFTGYCIPVSVSAVEGGVCGDGLTWSFDETSGTLTVEGSGDMADYTAASAPWYGLRSKITGLELSSGVTHLGDNALYGLNSLTYNSYGGAKYLGNSADPYIVFVAPDSERCTSMTLHESTKFIGSYAFGDCVKLTSVDIPAGLLEICGSAFANCPKLESADLPEGLLRIGASAFGGCLSLSNVRIPQSVISVGKSAFFRCREFTEVILPYGITEVPADLFKECEALEVVTVPASATSVSPTAFAGCTALREIRYGGSAEAWSASGAAAPDGVSVYFNSVCGPYLSWTLSDGVLTVFGTGEMYDFDVQGAPWYSERANIETIKVMPGVTYVGENAFFGCASLETVIYVGTADEWGAVQIADGNEPLASAQMRFIDCGKVGNIEWVFDRDALTLAVTGEGEMPSFTSVVAPWNAYKKQIVSLTVGEGITSIGSGAFSSMSALVSVSLPDSIRKIGSSAFTSCYSIQYNEYENANYLGNASNPYLALITVPSEERITSCPVHPDTLIIAGQAFCDVVSLRSVTIPEGVLVLEAGAFSNCPKLTALNIPASVEFIESAITLGCKALTSLTVDPANAYYRSDGNCLIERATGAVISGCEASVIPDDGSITAIGNSAFRGMRMTQIAIPDSVKSIGSYSFAGCTLLGSALLPDGVTSIGNNAFDGCTSLSSFTVPLGVTVIEKHLFNGCTSLASVSIHDGVTSVEAGAFYGCKALTTIHYSGTEESFASIKVDKFYSQNYYFLNATVRYPSSAENACGDGVVWSFDEELGILSVSGNGAMYSYPSTSDLPWDGVRDGIRSVSVWSGVTSVSLFSFRSCPNLTNVFIAKSVTSIGAEAFADCASLRDVWYADTPENWKKVAKGDGAIPDGAEVFFTSGTVGFCLGADEIYSFANSRNNFGKTYAVGDEDFIKLCNYVKIIYADDPKTAMSVINSLQKARASDWGGSCYGMALSSVLDKTGQIGFNENFCPDAATLYEVVTPLESAAVESAINYYHIAQYIPYLRSANCATFIDGKPDWRSGLYGLVEEAKKGEPILFTYGFGKSAHAIVVKGCGRTSGGGYILYAYDNRYPKRDVLIKIDRNFNSCTVNNTELCYYIEYTGTPDFFDSIDIDGPENDYASFVLEDPGAPTPPVTPDESAQITIKASGRVTITNAEGRIYVFENGELNGETGCLIVCDGDGDAIEYDFTVDDSESFTFIPECSDLYITVLSSSVYASSETTGASKVTVSSEGTSVSGGDITYTLSVSVNDGVLDMVQISGQTYGSVSLNRGEGSVAAIGADKENSRVTVFSNTVDADKFVIAKGYPEFRIVELSDTPGDFAIMGSSQEDGVFDVNIGIRLGERKHYWDYAGIVEKASLTKCGTEAYFCPVCGAVRLDHVSRMVSRVAGDANGDAALNAKDVLLMRRWFAGLDEPTDAELSRCDINYDLESDYKDILKLRRYLAGLEQ